MRRGRSRLPLRLRTASRAYTRRVQPPPTQYVERDGISIAYQVVGDGPTDLLISPGFVSHLDLAWTDAGTTRMLTRLSSFARLILYDKPGTGLSDPISHLPTLEERCADVEAVLDAVGSKQTVLFGISEGGPTSLLFAATRPERITSLVLYGTFAAVANNPDVYTPDVVARTRDELAEMRGVIENWGDGARLAKLFAPSLGARGIALWGIFARASASPRMAGALLDTVLSIDVRDVLPSVHVPTLVIHLDGDRVIPPACGELLAEGIDGARLVKLPGIDHVFWIGQNRELADSVIDEVERFVTGGVDRASTDRVLTTVLFTDIVSSTTRAAELGDRAWRDVLEAHDALVQRVVAEHGGRVVKHIGDGALSAFDGPAKAIRCAVALRDAVAAIDIELRAGVHTGECEVIGEDLAGMAVHIGARIGAFAGPGEVAVSSTVKELVIGSDIAFEDRGTHELKGVPEEWRVYVVGEQRGERAALDAADAHMRRSDRVAVTLARRLPRASRLGARLASGGLRSA